MPSTNFERLLEISATLADLNAASALLSWDQEINMPEGAALIRAEQLATLSGLVHQMATSPELSRILEELKQEQEQERLQEWQKALVRETAREHEHAVKLPEEHVREFARAQSMAHHAWKQARAESDFSIFADSLSHLVQLKRREAEHFGYAENPYDALIDLHEPGMTVAQLTPVFERLQQGTRALLGRIGESAGQVDASVLFKDFDPDTQLRFARETVKELGFNFDTGRIDLSAHPFCTSFAPTDVRLTTRIFRNDLRSCLFGLIHEAGHGMYEQGFDPRFARTALAGGISMGIHESQSLFWENPIARSEEFWRWRFPALRQAFPEQTAGLDSWEFFGAINVVKPSLIRIEADELTYNMHIILRFQIEEALINGRMEVADIPAVWNNMMQELLGVVPASDAEGCLQDIHWSFGGFGYFPSYTLGKLYAAMFFEQMEQEIPGLRDDVGAGRFDRILGWLRENIHHWGKVKTASELVADVCGRPLSEDAFLRYITAKVELVYGLEPQGAAGDDGALAGQIA